MKSQFLFLALGKLLSFRKNVTSLAGLWLLGNVGPIYLSKIEMTTSFFLWVNELRDPALRKNSDISGQEFCPGNSCLAAYISTRKHPWSSSESEPLKDRPN